MSVPVRSPGSRSGVNWMRLNGAWIPCASAFTAVVLARPGRPSTSTWPPHSRPMTKRSSRACWPTMVSLSDWRSARILCWMFDTGGVPSGWLGWRASLGLHAFLLHQQVGVVGIHAVGELEHGHALECAPVGLGVGLVKGLHVAAGLAHGLAQVAQVVADDADVLARVDRRATVPRHHDLGTNAQQAVQRG